MEELRGRRVLITGASRGIGAASARAFAEAGAKLALGARDERTLGALADELRERGADVVTRRCDVADAAAVAALVDACVDAFGGLDVLVNNAGLIEPIGQLAETDPAEWGQAVDVNLKGVYHGLRYGLPAMLAGGGGVVVNLSSGAATFTLDGWSAYCATKAAVLMLTRCTQAEYGDRGIRVVGLSPGTVATDMQATIKESGVNAVSQLDWSVHIPSEWAGRAVAWLATDDAADLAGVDFSLTDEAGRRRVGLPAPKG
ncbi:MAG: SDR family oxidoreductase [Pseudomonadales bacterium]|jgi:NAD(P)-dependent dehydrogenase (short-subunit alcohol dehydrogenase family)|nr:SDR family oxidoreductase [Pseudomonadales bacterium]